MRIIFREPLHAAALVKEMSAECTTLAKVTNLIVIVAFRDNYHAMNAMVLWY